MQKMFNCVLAAILVCATSVLTSCSDTTDNPVTETHNLLMGCPMLAHGPLMGLS